MSADNVDIIHAAEDYGEALRAMARSVVLAWPMVAAWVPHDESGKAVRSAITALDLASAEPFIRPGCERDEETGEWECGYPDESECGGYHPEADSEPTILDMPMTPPSP